MRRLNLDVAEIVYESSLPDSPPRSEPIAPFAPHLLDHSENGEMFRRFVDVAMNVHRGDLARRTSRLTVRRTLGELFDAVAEKLEPSEQAPVVTALSTLHALVCDFVDFIEQKDIPESDKAPREFLCPLTLHALRHPITCSDGHTYELAHITAWCERMIGVPTSPLTREVLHLDANTVNHALVADMTAWVKGQITIHDGWGTEEAIRASLGRDTCTSADPFAPGEEFDAVLKQAGEHAPSVDFVRAVYEASGKDSMSTLKTVGERVRCIRQLFACGVNNAAVLRCMREDTPDKPWMIEMLKEVQDQEFGWGSRIVRLAEAADTCWPPQSQAAVSLSDELTTSLDQHTYERIADERYRRWGYPTDPRANSIELAWLLSANGEDPVEEPNYPEIVRREMRRARGSLLRAHHEWQILEQEAPLERQLATADRALDRIWRNPTVEYDVPSISVNIDLDMLYRDRDVHACDWSRAYLTLVYETYKRNFSGVVLYAKLFRRGLNPELPARVYVPPRENLVDLIEGHPPSNSDPDWWGRRAGQAAATVLAQSAGDADTTIVLAQVGTAFTTSRVRMELSAQDRDTYRVIRILRTQAWSNGSRRLLPTPDFVNQLPDHLLPPHQECEQEGLYVTSVRQGERQVRVFWAGNVRVQPPPIRRARPMRLGGPQYPIWAWHDAFQQRL